METLQKVSVETKYPFKALARHSHELAVTIPGLTSIPTARSLVQRRSSSKPRSKVMAPMVIQALVNTPMLALGPQRH